MRTVSIRLEDLQKIVVPIGFVGENQYTQVRIDSKTIYDEYPNATPGLAIVPPVGSAYPATITRDGNVVIWDVLSSDVTAKGMGELQLTFYVGTMIAKSYKGRINILDSIVATGEAPTPIENWIENAQEVLGEFTEMTAEAETLPEGSSATAELTDEDGHKVLNLGIPKGDQGIPGYSPIATVSKSGDTATITVTDKNGTTTAQVSDGQDGFSPIATVTKSGDTATITITDKNGTTTAEVTDGEDGADGYSPSASVSKSGSKTTITITDKDGTTSAEVNDGTDGITPNVTAGTTTTLQPGEDATVTRRAGSPDSAPVFDFGIPKGEKGDPGEVSQAEFDNLKNALNALEPAATSGDVGKFLKAKTVEGGKVTEYELEEAGLPEGLPTEETAQELLAQETYNTGLTDSMLAVIGAIFNGLPQDEPATDILNSLSLECERLQAIYENWMSERSA